jgi:hypothetical protein
MRLTTFVAAAALAGTITTTADAAPPKRPVAYNPPGTVVVHRDENGRTRTKIIVQKRSYLDGGTEVMPGENSDTYRSTFLTHQASEGLGPNVIRNPQGPIPDPFFLPGKNNPWPGFQY